MSKVRVQPRRFGGFEIIKDRFAVFFIALRSQQHAEPGLELEQAGVFPLDRESAAIVAQMTAHFSRTGRLCTPAEIAAESQPQTLVKP